MPLSCCMAEKGRALKLVENLTFPGILGKVWCEISGRFPGETRHELGEARVVRVRHQKLGCDLE